MSELGSILVFHHWRKMEVKSEGSADSDQLLLCNHSPSYERSRFLTKENRKFVWELKENILIINKR